MKRIMISSLVVVSLLTACVMVPGRRGGVAVVPLPPIVELDVEPYYYHSGYHYHYDNGSWFYSTSRSGPWTDLPRGHYPKEVRYKNKGRKGDRGRDHDERRR